jgi:YHS domain-containing protein
MDLAQQKSPTQYETACGDQVDVPWRSPIVKYRGRQVIFCTVDCLKQFQKDPDAFMAGEIVHTNSNKRTKVQPDS